QLADAAREVEVLAQPGAYREAVLGSHPGAAAALDAAHAEAARRYERALANAEAHAAGLPDADREKAARKIGRAKLAGGEQYARDAAGHEHAPAGSPEGGRFVSQGGGGGEGGGGEGEEGGREKEVKKLIKAVAGPQEVTQTRARSGGEIGPNGEW